jgi:hypothetical protein
MTTQAVSGRRYFTKAWLMEQKSLIALLVLIAIVSTMSPNFFTVNNLFNILQDVLHQADDPRYQRKLCPRRRWRRE